MKHNILLTDMMFPNKYAKWRLVTIKSFMDEFQADVLVPVRTSICSSIQFEFDYDILKSWTFPLDSYDIYIFNPAYNSIQSFNSDFDGTAFNHKWPADYLFRHKSKRNTPLTLDYDFIYHIFYVMYLCFNDRFQFPKEKQIIHCYPGGGYTGPHCFSSIHPLTRIIPTQSFISSHVPAHFNSLPIFGGAFYYKDEILKYKSVNTNLNTPLTVCFTSLGNYEDKGAHHYVALVNFFHSTYPHIPIKCISIGNCPSSPLITPCPPMDQKSLSEFYYSNVDVIINLETGAGLNGFPLGCEAIIQGAVLFTTDLYNQNSNNNYNFDPFHIITFDYPSIAEKIVHLHTDRESLSQKSKALQEKMFQLFSYQNTMQKIFNWISETPPLIQ